MPNKIKTVKQFRKAMQKELSKILNELADCSICGICCKDERLSLLQSDINVISKKIGINKKNFLEKYTWYNESTKETCLNMPCPFLKNNKCKIYNFRPEMCKNYPVYVVDDFVHINEIEGCSISTHFIELFIEYLYETNKDNFDKFMMEYNKPESNINPETYNRNSVLQLYEVYKFLNWYHNKNNNVYD